MKVSDNPFPSLLVKETAAPAAPAAGFQRLFIDPTDHLLKVIDSAGTISTIGSVGGGGGTTGFHDDFHRPDAALDGNNGWVKQAPTTTDLAIISNQVQVPVAATNVAGVEPILHARNSADPNIIDITLQMSRVDTAGMTYLVLCTESTYQTALQVGFDGSDHTSLGAQLGIIQGGAGGPGTWDNDYGNWADFTGGVTVESIRAVYDDTTHILQVYQGTTLCYDVDVQAAISTYYGTGATPFPGIATLPDLGIISQGGIDAGPVPVETFIDINSV